MLYSYIFADTSNRLIIVFLKHANVKLFIYFTLRRRLLKGQLLMDKKKKTYQLAKIPSGFHESETVHFSIMEYGQNLQSIMEYRQPAR